MKLFLSIVLLLGILFSVIFRAESKELNNSSYLIAEYEDVNDIIDFLGQKNASEYFGLSISLKHSDDGKSLLLHSLNNHLPFSDFTKALETYLKNNPNNIFPLFIDYSGPENWLLQALNTSQIADYCLFLPIGETWPTIEEIKALGKRLLIFTFFQVNVKNNKANYAWNHIAEFPFTNFENPILEGYFSNGKPENKLLLLRHFTDDKVQSAHLPKNWLTINQNNLIIKHTLRCWQQCAKQPNFIFVDGKYAPHLMYLQEVLNTYPQVSGQVTFSGKPLEQVHWKGINNAISHGRFCFPITVGEFPGLHPFQNGYSFSPSEIRLNMLTTEDANIHFEASPFTLNESLTGAYTFDNSLNNFVNKNTPGINNNCEFTEDVQRGAVLKIQDSSFVILGKPEEYKIRNSSFTVSMFVKLVDFEAGDDYYLIGTSETEYRKGLHINIRNKKPYFGFYGSDVIGYKEIEPNVWYNLVVRYEKNIQEQSIFINGQKQGASKNHPSFIGNTELMIAKGFRQRWYISGYIDDLFIWDRALSNAEIEKLYNEEFEIKAAGNNKTLYGVLVFFLTGVIILMVRLNKKRKSKISQNISNEISKLKGPDLTTNAITLFGGFRVFDKEGVEITSLFPPKIKELFLLIMFYSLKSDRGISSKKITNIIWQGFTTKQATNNRNVSFNKLRNAITKLDGLSIHFENGYWKMNFDKKFKCDYLNVVNILKALNHKQTERYYELYRNVQSGNFLENSDWDWLDEFKSTMIFDTVDALLTYLQILKNNSEQDLAYEVADTILKLDDLNEQALGFIVAYLNNRDNQTKARYIFDKFTEKYFESYDEKFASDFLEFVEMN